MRIYELSKETGVSPRDILRIAAQAGVQIKSHMVPLTSEQERLVRAALSEADRVDSAGVAEPVERTIELRRMTVSDFAVVAVRPTAEIVLSLLKQKIVAAKNHLLTEQQVESLAEHYGIKIIRDAQKSSSAGSAQSLASQAGAERRAPVVVVIGHVDHGKTTLLDYIRKTRVALREAGGITQHLGAYQVASAHGDIVFLDTPGHEAFSMIRVRGLKCADIAILVVAADDGVMPQTVEAIERAQAAQVPIIVALNKVDKASAQQIEATRVALSRYGLISEEWGGQTPMQLVSAKTGQGVDALLDLIVLQSQVMDLLTDTQVPAQGFVLEAQMERGRGAVATIICQRGTLRIGDFFSCGTVWGKVAALVDWRGVRMQFALPSQPVKVSGFDALPGAGDVFEVIDAAAYHAGRSKAVPFVSPAAQGLRGTYDPRAVNCIVKTDNSSSREALSGALSRISTQSGMRPINIVYAAAGPVSERDVQLAADVTGIVIAFHAGIDAAAQALATHAGVPIYRFDIIYRAVEALEKIAYEPPPVKKSYKKIGEATVLKVFDIKGVGIIAGAQVVSGRFVRDGKVVVWRGRQRIGEGLIKSLQRDKKTVKEVHTGFECAFSVDKIGDFAADDRVECYQEVADVS